MYLYFFNLIVCVVRYQDSGMGHSGVEMGYTEVYSTLQCFPHFSVFHTAVYSTLHSGVESSPRFLLSISRSAISVLHHRRHHHCRHRHHHYYKYHRHQQSSPSSPIIIINHHYHHLVGVESRLAKFKSAQTKCDLLGL